MGNFVMNDVIGETTMKALGTAVPDRVTGGWNRGLNASFGGIEPETGKPFFGLPLLSNKGGSGAGKELDGWDCIGILTCGGAFAFDDYEIFEANLPATLLEHELCAGTVLRRSARGRRDPVTGHPAAYGRTGQHVVAAA